MTNEEFVVFWSENDDNSFAANPPNATLSILGDENIEDVVVELTNPVLDGDSLSYDVTVLEGELLETGGNSSLFIDPVGMPLSPVSIAGVARRSARRTVRRRY